MSIRSLWNRAMGSLYFVPGLFIAGAATLAVVVNRLDVATASESFPFLLPTSLAGARTLLASIAGATITVAALVFSITALTVQLASSQYSPRVLDGFLRDRGQQLVIGVVVGTFTFSLVSLATMGAGVRDSEGVFAAWAATVASALALATVVAIVYFVDHITRNLRVENIVRRISAETTRSIEKMFADRDPEPLESWDTPAMGDAHEIMARSSGWLQRFDAAALLNSVPANSVVQLERPVGSFVVRGDVLLRVWTADENHSHTGEPSGIDIGDSRTATQDPGFGLRQLTDIALRALSPGVNDPATAADAVRHLAEPLLVALTGSPPRRTHLGANGSRLVVPDQLGRDDYLAGPFGEIRQAAAGQPLVLRAMAETLSAMRAQLERHDLTAAVDAIDEELAALRRMLGGAPAPSRNLREAGEVVAASGLAR